MDRWAAEDWAANYWAACEARRDRETTLRMVEATIRLLGRDLEGRSWEAVVGEAVCALRTVVETLRLSERLDRVRRGEEGS